MKLALLSFLSGFVRFKSHRSQQGRKPRCQALCGSFYESFPGKLHRQPSTPVESRWMTGRERVYKRDNIMSSGICRGRGKQSARYERITAEYVAHTSTILLPFFLPPPSFLSFPQCRLHVIFAHSVLFPLSNLLLLEYLLLRPPFLHFMLDHLLRSLPPFRSLPRYRYDERNENLTRNGVSKTVTGGWQGHRPYLIETNLVESPEKSYSREGPCFRGNINCTTCGELRICPPVRSIFGFKKSCLPPSKFYHFCIIRYRVKCYILPARRIRFSRYTNSIIIRYIFIWFHILFYFILFYFTGHVYKYTNEVAIKVCVHLLCGETEINA